jgi:hypothetical protein|mmetsp:Transcript_14031/g.41610  ORF Transcript_14031/g.41610 Transcript_14031/m.41610 type:complete len:208 (-) Transcript_14031:47-670(-)
MRCSQHSQAGCLRAHAASFSCIVRHRSCSPPWGASLRYRTWGGPNRVPPSLTPQQRPARRRGVHRPLSRRSEMTIHACGPRLAVWSQRHRLLGFVKWHNPKLLLMGSVSSLIFGMCVCMVADTMWLRPRHRAGAGWSWSKACCFGGVQADQHPAGVGVGRSFWSHRCNSRGGWALGISIPECWCGRRELLYYSCIGSMCADCGASVN